MLLEIKEELTRQFVNFKAIRIRFLVETMRKRAMKCPAYAYQTET